jgi:hypothetical protein
MRNQSFDETRLPFISILLNDQWLHTLQVTNDADFANSWVKSKVVQGGETNLGVSVQWVPVSRRQMGKGGGTRRGRHRISLMQLATSKDVLILQLAHMRPSKIPSLVAQVCNSLDRNTSAQRASVSLCLEPFEHSVIVAVGGFYKHFHGCSNSFGLVRRCFQIPKSSSMGLASLTTLSRSSRTGAQASYRAWTRRIMPYLSATAAKTFAK